MTNVFFIAKKSDVFRRWRRLPRMDCLGVGLSKSGQDLWIRKNLGYDESDRNSDEISGTWE
jgi:hypothetical protein